MLGCHVDDLLFCPSGMLGVAARAGAPTAAWRSRPDRREEPDDRELQDALHLGLNRLHDVLEAIRRSRHRPDEQPQRDEDQQGDGDRHPTSPRSRPPGRPGRLPVSIANEQGESANAEQEVWPNDRRRARGHVVVLTAARWTFAGYCGLGRTGISCPRNWT